MGRMKELSAVADEIRQTGEKLIGIADSIAGMFGGSDAAEPDKPKPPTLETVRAVLAEKSRDGHTDKIRELLEKHGATKLSEIDPGEYAALLAEAEVL